MKCAIYIRVSTQSEEQEQSLVNQKDLLTGIAQKEGWEIYDYYTDVKTATKAGRINYNRLVKDVKENKFDIILSKELSRLARNELIAMELQQLTSAKGIKIYTLDGASDVKNETDMYGFYAWHYAKESRDTSRRIKTAFRSKNLRGERTGSNAPYGYKLFNKKLVPKNDETTETVKLIFSSYISGKSYDQIASELTKNKIKTPSQISNKKNQCTVWHGSSVRLILQNQAYIGDTVGHKQETISANTYNRRKLIKEEYIVKENTHEPIILRDDFFTVQNMLEIRTRNKGFRPKPNNHLFSQLLFCKDCGKGLHFKSNRKGYVCGTYDKWGNDLCTSHIVREKDLEELILNDLNLIINNKTNLVDVLIKKINLEKQKINNEITSLEKKIEEDNTLKFEALKKYTLNKLTEDEYKLITSSIDNSKIDNDILILNQKLAILDETDHYKKITELLGSKEITKLDKSLLNKVINKIEIKENGDAIIYYSFKNPFEEKLEEAS